MRTKIITEKTKLEELPDYMQKPIWKMYHGLNFYNMAKSSMKSLGEHGYKRAIGYIGRKIQIKKKK